MDRIFAVSLWVESDSTGGRAVELHGQEGQLKNYFDAFIFVLGFATIMGMISKNYKTSFFIGTTLGVASLAILEFMPDFAEQLGDHNHIESRISQIIVNSVPGIVQTVLTPGALIIS